MVLRMTPFPLSKSIGSDPTGNLDHSGPGLLLWVFGGAFVGVFFFLRDFLRLDGLTVAHEVMWGRDFINVWTAGHILREGKIEILYDLAAYHRFQEALIGTVLGRHNFSYPPLTLPLTLPFAYLPYLAALAAWLVSTGGLFVYAARPFLKDSRLSAWAALATPAAIVNIWAGHYGFLIGAIWLAAWHALDNHPRRAGILFGLLAIKPHIAVLVPIVLMLRRQWRVCAIAAATVGVLVALSIVFFGIAPWREYLTVTTGQQARMIDAGRAFFHMMSTSTATAMLQLGAPWALAMAAQSAMAALGLCFVVVAARSQATTASLAFLTATATFLVLPYAFNYDLTVVTLGAALLMTRNWQNLNTAEQCMVVAGFLSAQIGMFLAAFGAPIMPLMLAGLALVQLRLVQRAGSLTCFGAAPAAAAAARSI